MTDDPAFVDNVAAIADSESLANVVVGHEHPDPSLTQLANEPVDLGYGDRVDPGEGFVQQHEARPCGERPGDLHPAPLAPREVLAARVAQVLETEGLHELHGPLAAHRGVQAAAKLKDREQVPFHRELSKDGRFLWQIAEPESRAHMHRAVGEIDVVEVDGPVVGGNEADQHVEARGFSRPVRTEETHYLSALHIEAHILDDHAGAVTFREPPGAERAHSSSSLRRIVTRRPSSPVSAPAPWMLPVTES